MCCLGPRYVFIYFILFFNSLILPPQHQHQQCHQSPPTSCITPPTSYLHHTQWRPIPTTLSTSPHHFKGPNDISKHGLGCRYFFWIVFIMFLIFFFFLDQFWLATRPWCLCLTSHTSPTSPTSPPLFWGPEKHVKTCHLVPRCFSENLFFLLFLIFFTGFDQPPKDDAYASPPTSHPPHTHHFEGPNDASKQVVRAPGICFSIVFIMFLMFLFF